MPPVENFSADSSAVNWRRMSVFEYATDAVVNTSHDHRSCTTVATRPRKFNSHHQLANQYSHKQTKQKEDHTGGRCNTLRRRSNDSHDVQTHKLMAVVARSRTELVSSVPGEV